MKIGIISDIHSNLDALVKVLKELKLEGVEDIFCCGDIVGYNAYPNECIQMIRENKIKTVMGNHDLSVITGDTSNFNELATEAVEWTSRELYPSSLKFLSALPREMRLDISGVKIYITHGSPRSISEYIFPNIPASYILEQVKDSDIILLGHTHFPMIKRASGKIIINPGSVGQPRDLDPRGAYAILDITHHKAEIKRFDYDIKKASEAVFNRGLPYFLGERLFYGR